MMENFISSPLWYNLALTLIHFLWQGCLIALALKLLLILTPYNKSQLRYTWATGAMLTCLVVPIITYIYIYQPSYVQSGEYADDMAAMISSQILSSEEAITWYQDIFDALPYISMVWIACVSLLAVKLFIELYNVNRLPKIGSIAPDRELMARFTTLSQQVGLGKTPELLISLKTNIPMAIGWLKPVILIPASMLTGLTPAQLDMLILHELAHIRRHDYLVNFIQTLVETLLFFHPAVRWMSKQMRNEREYCSDDIAVTISGNPVAYAHTLADAASVCVKHRHHAIPTMAMAASGGDLKQRVVRLVDQHHCASNDDSGKFLATVLIIFSVLTMALKPYLNTHLIDLTSGKISLFQTANEFIQKKPASAGHLSATSIARLLLAQEQTTEQGDDANINAKDDSVAVTTVEITTSAIDTELPSEQAVISQEDANNNLIKTHNIDKVNKQIKKRSVASNEPSQVEKTLDTNTESLLAKPVTPSPSELAFERSEGRQTQSKMQNPYAEQVADLRNEPLYSEVNTDLPIVTITQEPVTQDIQADKPRYTISSVKKTVVTQPKKIRKSAEVLRSPEPRYPSTAKRKGLELDVKVNFVIDKSGYVKDIEFEPISKVNYFRSAIRTAMAKWRFLPAKVNGKPVESKMTKIFSFSLMK